MAWFGDVFTRVFANAGVPLPPRKTYNIVSGAVATDNPATESTDLAFTGAVATAGADGVMQLKAGATLAAGHISDNGICLTGSLPYCVGSGKWLGLNAGDASSIASQGDLRFPDTASAFMDVAGDICLFQSDGTTLNLGATLLGGAAHTEVNVEGGTTSALCASGAQFIRANSGISPIALEVAFPMIGMASSTSPYGAVNGEAVIPLAGATHDLTASEYAMACVRVTGTGTNIIRYPLGGAGAGAYFKHVHNAGAGTLSVRDTVGTTPGATLAAGTSAWFKFYNDGSQRVKQITASFAPI
jgi:hypothetical protein